MTALEFRKNYQDEGVRAKVVAGNLAHLKRVLDLLFDGQYKSLVGLEIGCFEGGTTKWLLENGIKTMTVVDTFEGSLEHTPDATRQLMERFYANLGPLLSRVRILKGRSDKMLADLYAYGNTFEFIYVDASHDSRDVIFDGLLGWKMLCPGGIMVFDDYCWDFYDGDYRNPKPAIDFFLAAFADDLELLEMDYQVSIRKKA